MTFESRMVINIDELPKWMLEKARLEIGKHAFAIQANTAANAPVDTGALKNSITAEKENENLWTISDGVEYGVYQELGTRHIPAKRFMTQACEQEADKFFEDVKRALQ